MDDRELPPSDFTAGYQLGLKSGLKRRRWLRRENRELNQLFKLQHTRSIEADKLWRKAHPGNELVIPDLGRLLEWMMEEMKK